jgi:hypothetical protein
MEFALLLKVYVAEFKYLKNPVSVQNIRRPRRKWEDNIEVDLEEMRREEVG